MALNAYFQQVEQWRVPDIQQRAAVLTEQALHRWPTSVTPQRRFRTGIP